MTCDFPKWLEYMIGLHATQMHEHVRWLQGLDIRPQRRGKRSKMIEENIEIEEEPIEIEESLMID